MSIIHFQNNPVLEYTPNSDITEKRKKMESKKWDIFIQELPEDIIRYIYKEYIEVDLYYNTFIASLYSKNSICLNIIDIKPIIPIILSNPKLVTYCCNHVTDRYAGKFFELVYITHKIKNEKNFMNLKKGYSFALSLLMFIHH
jgi:hypothetical protein